MEEYNRVKHLELIENIVDRMNRNCFQIKFGVITIVSAILAIYANNGNELYILICFVPLVCGCIMDCFYLKLEKCYKDLYNDVKDGKIMDYELSIQKYRDRYSIINFVKSSSIKWMYISLLFLLIFLWA